MILRKLRLRRVRSKIDRAERLMARYDKCVEEYGKDCSYDAFFYRVRGAREELKKELDELVWKEINLWQRAEGWSPMKVPPCKVKPDEMAGCESLAGIRSMNRFERAQVTAFYANLNQTDIKVGVISALPKEWALVKVELLREHFGNTIGMKFKTFDDWLRNLECLPYVGGPGVPAMMSSSRQEEGSGQEPTTNKE